MLPLARSFPESVYAQVVFVRVLEPKNAMKECFRAQELFDPWTYPLFELFLLTSVSEPVEGIFDDFLRLQKHMPYVDFIVSTTDTVPEGILAILDGHTFEEIGASEEMLAAISYINGLGVSYEEMKHVRQN
ncbi:MAG: hypothetical protein U5N86_00470 [Planctomycetota bacterium]|nr:hypothetical protein [Planctomycetota bacterium]